MIRVLKDWVYAVVCFAGTILSILAYYSPVWGKLQAEGKWAIIFLGTFATVFLIDSVWARVFGGRLRRYAEVISDINGAFAALHSAVAPKGAPDTAFFLALQKFCDETSKAFSAITGSSCSVAIKLAVLDEDDQGLVHRRVFTLARDGTSTNKRQQQRLTPNEPKHWISKNSDFRFIEQGLTGTPHGQTWFLKNVLPLVTGYQNTSFEAYGTPAASVTMRMLYWPLPYRSTLIVPLAPLDAQLRRSSSEGLKGFLCVDSRTYGAFKKSYDLDMIQGLADALYHKIKEIDPKAVERGLQN